MGEYKDMVTDDRISRTKPWGIGESSVAWCGMATDRFTEVGLIATSNLSPGKDISKFEI